MGHKELPSSVVMGTKTVLSFGFIIKTAVKYIYECCKKMARKYYFVNTNA